LNKKRVISVEYTCYALLAITKRSSRKRNTNKTTIITITINTIKAIKQLTVKFAIDGQEVIIDLWYNSCNLLMLR